MLVSFLVFIYLFAKRRCAPLKILTVTPCTVSIQGIYNRLALKNPKRGFSSGMLLYPVDM
jgi:hypothetical protein